MPYASNDELPERVRTNVPSKTGKDLFRQVVNSELDDGRSESVAFSAAWAALSNAGFEQNDDGKWIKKASPTLSSVHTPGANWRRRKKKPKKRRRMSKRRLGDDRYTLEIEAAARAWELGFEGQTHVHESADGEAQFMPGPSHDAYLQRMAGDSNYEEHSMSQSSALRIFFETAIDRLVGKSDSDPIVADVEGQILKLDEEQRIVYGWASVITENGEHVVDGEGDVILPAELEKATTDFMLDVRMAKAMHEGGQIGEVVHSLPLTYTLAESLGIDTEDEGWIVAMKIHSDEVWGRVKSGELSAFSIGGSGTREALQ